MKQNLNPGRLSYCGLLIGGMLAIASGALKDLSHAEEHADLQEELMDSLHRIFNDIDGGLSEAVGDLADTLEELMERCENNHSNHDLVSRIKMLKGFRLTLESIKEGHGHEAR